MVKVVTPLAIITVVSSVFFYCLDYIIEEPEDRTLTFMTFLITGFDNVYEVNELKPMKYMV